MRYISTLTGLRFFAAFAIVINHLGPIIFKIDGRVPWSDFYHGLSSFGMSLFFVLSGFIIHYNYHTKVANFSWPGIYDFFVARFARLYPLYLLLLAYDILGNNFVLYANGYEKSQYLQALPYSLTCVQSWFYFFVGNHPITFPYKLTYVSWSISTEFFLYLVYPVLCFFAMPITTTRSRALAAVAATSLATAALYLLHSHAPLIQFLGEKYLGIVEIPSASPQVVFWDWFLYISPYTRVFEFLSGCFIAHLLIGILNKPEGKYEFLIKDIALPFSLVCMLIMLFYPPYATVPFLGKFLSSLGYLPHLSVLIFSCARYPDSFLRVLSTSFFVTLGDASYSIYLLHMAVLQNAALVSSVPPLPGEILLVVLKAVLLVFLISGISIASYRMYESPARRWVRRILSVKPEKEPRISPSLENEELSSQTA